MKWNWGTGIFIVILLFIAACVIFIIYTRSQVWTLVEADYYPKELRHEEKLVKMRNANALSSPLQVKTEDTSLVIRFPDDFRGKELTGSILIYRPSDESLDINIPVAADTSLTRSIPLSRLSKGRYIVKVDWSSEGKDYYREQDLFLP